tara:strand:+ start:268 stop:930 length:663 start_codon:yes stop_codon:yes gene_type:complete
MLNALFAAASNPTIQQAAKGLFGFAQNQKGNRMMEAATNPMTYDQAATPFQKSQGLVDNLSNFSNFSGQAMDLSNMQGNQAAQSAAMMGMGGSAANMLRNRMRASGINQAYSNFLEAQPQIANMQLGIDRNIAQKMYGDDQFQRNYRLQRGGEDRLTGMANMAAAGSALFGPDRPNAQQRQEAFGAIGNVLGKDGLGGMMTTGVGGLMQGARDIRNFFSG